MLFNFITGLSFILNLFGILIDIKIISLLFLFFNLIYFIKKKSIIIPFYPVFFLLFFLIFASLTLFFSYDKASNLEVLLVFFTSFFSFLIAYQNQKKLSFFLKYLFIYGSIITITVIFITKIFHLEDKYDPFSLIYFYYYHNPSSLFLTLTLSCFLYFFIKESQKKYLILFLIIFPFFFFGFSRTAYIALILSLLIIISKEKIKLTFVKKILIGIIFLTTLFGLIFFNKNNFFSKKIINFFKINKEKTIFGNREKYVINSLKVFLKNPLGVGGKNLDFHTSLHRFDLTEETTTSHNFFIDVLAEYGIFTFLFFMFFLYCVLKNSIKNELFYIFLTYNFLFLGSFLHRYDFFLIFYFIIAGLILKNKREIKINNNFYIILIIFIILFLNILISISNYFFYYQNQKEKAIKIYPLKWQFYVNLIYELKQKKDYNEALKYNNKLISLFKNGGEININKAIDIFELKKDKIGAIKYFEQAFLEKPIYITEYFDKYFSLLIEKYGEKDGKKHTEKFIKIFLKTINPPKNTYLFKTIKANCNFYKLSCF